MKPEEVALRIIDKSFEGKTDLAGRPYKEHLIRVSEGVPDYGSGNLKIIALLHDLLEDCPEWNEKSLRCFFNHEIVNCVVCLTKDPEEDYFDYIQRIMDYPNNFPAYVKRADLRDNMDITRLPILDDKATKRLKKYHKAYQLLSEN